MEIKEYNFEQRSPEWYAVRRLKVTSTGAKILMAVKGLGKGAETYALQLIADELMETFDDDGFVNHAMQYGIDTEPIAKVAYEEEKMVDVREVGFIERDSFLGASPDGLVGDDGCVEIKCPQPTGHLTYLNATRCPKEHHDQVQFQMYVSGRTWCDFISFNDYFKEGYQLKIIRVEVDPTWVKLFEIRLREFKVLYNQLRKQYVK